jgi:TonB family protein
MKFRIAAVVLALALPAGGVNAQAPAPTAGPPHRPMTISNPDWVELPNGDEMADAYPEVAREAQVKGVAKIECKVAPAGTLYDCYVLFEAPSGWGFGQASLEIAPSFKMKPKMVNGKPVAGGTVIIPVNWRMPEAPPPRVLTPTEEDMALARKLPKLLKVDPAGVILSDFYGSNIVPIIRDMDPDKARALRASWKAAADKLSSEFEEYYARAAAQTYSHQELVDIVAFFEMSSGQALLQHLYEVPRRAMQDTRPVFHHFLREWQASYCAQTACGDSEARLFARVGAQIDGLPGSD